MAFPVTPKVDLVRRQVNLRPQLVLSIDGVDTKYGAVQIYEYVRIGQPNLFIDNFDGDPWVIGGYKLLEDQGDYVQLGGSGGTTTRINQQLQPDKGLGTSVTQMNVTLIDKNQEISRLISPGFEVPEILGRKAKVQIGFQDTAYPEDYVTIFRGMIEDIQSGAGFVTFALSSTEQKKRQSVFIRRSAKLATAIAGSGAITTIVLDADPGFYIPVAGPSGGFDSDISFYVQIGDEYFRYTGKSGNTLTGVTRNPAPFDFGEIAHDVGDDVNSMVRLQGSGLDLARKMLFSGRSGNFVSSVAPKHFVRISPTETNSEAILFYGIDVSEVYGLYAGDFISSSGAANGANNFTNRTITEIVQTNDGSYVLVSGAALVLEEDTAGLIAFRSQWDVWDDGCAMSSDEVDLAEFDFWYTTFLSGFNFDFRLKDSAEARTFIEEQILRPMGAFSVQRKARTSMSYHIGPIPGADILTLSQENIENAPKLKIRRSLSKNYYNTVIFNLEQDVNSGKYLITKTNTDPTSISDFNIGQRSLTVNATGMRTTTGGAANANSAANRFLSRYKRGAEFIDNVEIQFGIAFTLEIGDVVLVDTSSLQMTDIDQGKRAGLVRLFQILNKSMDIQTGKVSVSLVDTGFDTAARYGLIGPASLVRSGASGTQFTIYSAFRSRFGANEFLKWTRYDSLFVRVRSPNGITRNAVAEVQSFSGNTVTLVTTLGFTPQPDDIMEFADYNESGAARTLIYVFMRNTDPFDDGKNRYQML